MLFKDRAATNNNVAILPVNEWIDYNAADEWAIASETID